MEGLDWQPLHIPLAAGLQQRTDDRARSSQALDIANDVQFDELGGIQTRKPFALLPTAIDGGGALADVRRPVDNGTELLCFTKDAMYSYADALQKWISRGTHLAVTVDEQTAFAETFDSTSCDRAELADIVFYAWEIADTETIKVMAVDKETGAVVLAPIQVSNDGLRSSGVRPRLVALETVVLLIWVDTTDPSHNLVALVLDPADLSGSVGAVIAEIESGIPTDFYDVEKVPSEDLAILALAAGGAGYVLYSIPPIIGDATTTNKARQADGPIAVACTPDGASVLIVRTDEQAGTHDILGDLITISTLADTAHVSKAIGTAPAGANTLPQQITAAFRSVAVGGQYVAHAFWHYGETPLNPALSLQPTVKTNTLDTAGTLGIESTFAVAQGVGSRAFDHDGRVFVHLSFAQPTEHRVVGGTTTFGPALQNTLFLYRDDKHLAAKIAPNTSGGHPARRGLLPGVTAVAANEYAWCATERRIIPSDSDRFVFSDTPATAARYSDRGPRDVTITFDDDAARRCVRLGATLYVVGGLVLQYDGRSLVELGWQVMPFVMQLEEMGTGDLDPGTYAYRPAAVGRNGRGEIDRSSTAVIGERSVTGGPPNGINVTVRGPVVSRRPTVAVELWRTEKDPTADALFNLVTSPDPADAGAASNAYHSYDLSAGNFTATLVDQLADDDITERPAHPVTGAVLEYLAPPAAKVILAMEDRLVLGDVAGDPDRLWYSRQRLDGEVASFHGRLVVEVPPAGGRITALAALPNTRTLIAFRESAVYALEGSGFDNTLGGANYGPARQLASDVGALSQESVVVTPFGLLFQSHKGWQLLDLGQGVTYVGAAVSDYDAEPVLAAHLVESQHQVRILTGSRMLVWDYLAKQWAEWTIVGGLGACLWNGAHLYLSAAGLAQQQTTYVDLTFGMDVETAWIKPSDQQGFQRCRKVLVLGALMSSDVNVIRIRIAYDYDDSTYVDDRYWDISPTVVGGPLQLKIGPKRQQFQSIKIRLTPMVRTEVVPEEGPPVISYSPPTGEAIKLTGLALEIGFKRLNPRLPAAQRS